MQKLDAVEEARALMTEGQSWGTWKWLLEKRTVREAADRATEALAQANRKARRAWSEDLRNAYKEVGKPGAKRMQEIDPKIKAAMERVREADEEAKQATDDAEAMFAEAERRMSAGMAREGAQKALESYDLREKAIRKAEAAARTFTSV